MWTIKHRFSSTTSCKLRTSYTFWRLIQHKLSVKYCKQCKTPTKFYFIITVGTGRLFFARILQDDERAKRICCRTLHQILSTSHDVNVLAVACHDIGCFVRAHPPGKGYCQFCVCSQQIPASLKTDSSLKPSILDCKCADGCRCETSVYRPTNQAYRERQILNKQLLNEQ